MILKRLAQNKLFFYKCSYLNIVLTFDYLYTIHMSDKSITVLDLLDLDLKGHNSLELHCIAGRAGLARELTVSDINRPGLALCGFYEAFSFERVELFGRGEVAYLEKLEAEGNVDAIKTFLSYHMPCVVFSHSINPSEFFVSLAESEEIPILQTSLDSTEFSQRLLRVFSELFAPKKTMHGVFVEVYGVGILLTGSSGVGKSETALELVERGHRLVADDIVEIRCVNGNTILGQGANKLISHHMEIRGLGIIDISQLYGVGAIREQKEVQIVVKLESWDQNKIYDRIGNGGLSVDLLGVKIPLIEIPVKPGRNLPIIIEAAAMNERLKSMGYFSAKEFNKNILRWVETSEAQRAYNSSEDLY